jgi:hypothetical protein
MHPRSSLALHGWGIGTRSPSGSGQGSGRRSPVASVAWDCPSRLVSASSPNSVARGRENGVMVYLAEWQWCPVGPASPLPCSCALCSMSRGPRTALCWRPSAARPAWPLPRATRSQPATTGSHLHADGHWLGPAQQSRRQVRPRLEVVCTKLEDVDRFTTEPRQARGDPPASGVRR